MAQALFYAMAVGYADCLARIDAPTRKRMEAWLESRDAFNRDWERKQDLMDASRRRIEALSELARAFTR